MSKHEDNPDMKVLKTTTTKTLSGKSTLTYQVGVQDDVLHVRISKNTGGGFFSNEWISMNDVRSVLDEHPEGTPVTSFILQPLFRGKSVNTPAFLLAALVHEKLLRPMKGKKRNHEPVDPEEFTAKVEKLTSPKPKGTTGTTSKRVTKKTVTKKAAIKKKAASRRKTSRTV
jgi:hypothetical protein